MKIQTLKMDRQRKIALATLAAVAALAFWPETDRPVAAPREALPAGQPAQAREPAPAMALPSRDAMPVLARDPFSPEAPKKPIRTVVVTAPAMPVNPYRFAGELRVGGAVQRFLARGDDTFEAKPGDALDDGYVVESVNERAIVLVHRPSGAHAALAVGAPAWEDPARSRVMQAGAPAASSPAAIAGDPRAVALRLDALSGNLPRDYFVATGQAAN